MIITARAVQGVFGAVLISSTKSLLVTVYSDEDERARVMGVFSATMAAGGAVGLVLGGVLTSALGWRWCLYVNVAFSLVALIVGPRVLPALSGNTEVRIDLRSVLSAALGMAGLVYGLGEAASAGWSSIQVICSFAVAAVALTVFVARQIGHTDRLLPLRVVLNRSRGWAMIGLIVNGVSTYGMFLILTYQLQSIMGYSALQTGLALIPFALVASITAALLTPLLMVRIPPRWLVTAGIAVEAAGLIPLIWLTPHTGYLPLVLTATVIEGLGTGVATPATLNTALSGVLATDSGAAGAGTSAASQLGSSIGAALLNTIAATAAASYLTLHPGARHRHRHGPRLHRRHGLGRGHHARRRPSHRALRPRQDASTPSLTGMRALGRFGFQDEPGLCEESVDESGPVPGALGRGRRGRDAPVARAWPSDRRLAGEVRLRGSERTLPS